VTLDGYYASVVAQTRQKKIKYKQEPDVNKEMSAGGERWRDDNELLWKKNKIKPIITQKEKKIDVFVDDRLRENVKLKWNNKMQKKKKRK
jgi:hypothetical protein